MKVLNLYILSFFLLVAISCKKKKYPETEVIVNTAIYYSKFTVNNSPVSLEAGVNDYYMYSSYTLGSDSLISFVADLKQKNCTDCPNSLKIQLNASAPYAPGFKSLIDSSLQVKKYSYLSGNPGPSYIVAFHAVSPGSTGYYWDFGDGTFSTLAEPVKTFDAAGKYSVCLTANKGPYVSSICNAEKINASDKSCKTYITAVAGANNSISFKHHTTGGKQPYQYLWNFGDGATSSQSEPLHTFKARGSAGISLRVVDANGDTAFARYNAVTLNDASSYAANYYPSSITQIPSNLALSRIVVSWVDADGNTFTSTGAQPGDSYFEVLSVEESSLNEKNQPTKKITARFKCKVYNGSRAINIDDAEVVLCVAYIK